MRKMLFVLTMFVPLCQFCFGQNDERVVLMRTDRWGPAISALHVFKNGHSIRRFQWRSVYVYNSDDVNGEYRFGSNSLIKAVKHGQRITVAGKHESPVLIQLRFRWGVRPRLREINASDLKDYYANNKWFRKRLYKAGYKSIEDLVGSDKAGQRVGYTAQSDRK